MEVTTLKRRRSIVIRFSFGGCTLTIEIPIRP